MIGAVTKDEQLWQNSIVIIKKKALKMHEYYTKMSTLEIHLKGKQESWQNVVVISSAGPATTLIMKTKTSQQGTLDIVKAWASAEGVSRELAIFKLKAQVQKLKEKPLIEIRNALTNHFGVRTDSGMRPPCSRTGQNIGRPTGH